MQVELKTFQQQLLTLFTNLSERDSFLQSSESEYAAYKNIARLPKKSVSIYAGLISSTADGTMSSIFPAVRALYSEVEWQKLLEKYFLAYKQDHYRLNSIARNFSKFLQQKENSKPWLAEIADYEYLELATEEHEAEIDEGSFTELKSQAEIINLCPKPNPTLCLRTYNFDVEQATSTILEGSEFSAPAEPLTTHIAFFRDPKTHRCRRLQLGQIARATLLASLSGTLSYAQIMQKVLVAENISGQNIELETLISDILEIVNEFHATRLFTGNTNCV